MAVAVLDQRALQPHEMSVSEIERYLGMPAQAISYKWGSAPDARARRCASPSRTAFSLKRFHAYALALVRSDSTHWKKSFDTGARLTRQSRDNVPLMVEQVVQAVAHQRSRREATAVRTRAGA